MAKHPSVGLHGKHRPLDLCRRGLTSPKQHAPRGSEYHRRNVARRRAPGFGQPRPCADAPELALDARPGPAEAVTQASSAAGRLLPSGTRMSSVIVQAAAGRERHQLVEQANELRALLLGQRCAGCHSPIVPRLDGPGRVRGRKTRQSAVPSDCSASDGARVHPTCKRHRHAGG